MANNRDAGTSRNRGPNLGAVLAQFMEGITQVPVTFVNPSFDSGDESDRWVLILPVGGTIKAVRTELSGFQYKTDLRQIAMAMLGNPEKVEPHYCDVPQIADESAAKLIVMWVPVVPVGSRAEAVQTA